MTFLQKTEGFIEKEILLLLSSNPELFMCCRVRLFVAPWTGAHQAPLSLEFSTQEYSSGLSVPSPGDLPYPGIEPRPPTLQADSLTSEPPGKRECKYHLCDKLA